MQRVPVICVDGPSGVGKGTLSLQLADSLGWHLLDSGVLYRVLGLACSQSAVALDDAPAVAAMARSLDIRFQSGSDGVRVWLGDSDVTVAIRTEAGGRRASEVAVHVEVREALLHRQRELARLPGLIADGRDMGTVVFPDASLKIFLTASAEARAERRLLQLQGMGESVRLARLLADIGQRDARDESRAASPLVAAEDAIVVDSTSLTADAVMHLVRGLAVSRGIIKE